MGVAFAILCIPVCWWLGGVGLAWLVALLRPDTLRSGSCKHCAYDRRDVQGYLPCPECGLSIGEARRRIPRLPRPGQCVPAALTSLVLPAGVLIWWVTPPLAGFFGAWVGVVGLTLLVLLLLVCLALPFGWAQFAEWRFLSRLSGEIGWSFVVGPIVGLVIGVVGGGAAAALAHPPSPLLAPALGWGVYGAIAGVGLGPLGMVVWVLGAMYTRAVSGGEARTARPMRMLH